VVLQVAVAVLTLSGTAMLSAGRASFARPYFGFETQPLVVVRLAVTSDACAQDCGPHLTRLANSVSERLRQFPAVAKVTAADALPQPLVGTEGKRAPVSSAGVKIWARYLFVDRDFFGTLGVNVVGRDLGEVEVSDRRNALVVSDALAKLLWSGANPIGRAVSVRLPEASAEFVVVGVAPDLNYISIDDRSRRMAYLPLSALPRDTRELRVLVRTASHSARAVDALRAAVDTLDSERSLRPAETYDTARGAHRDVMDEIAFIMGLMLPLSLMAIAIAVAGVGGVTLAAVVANQKTLAIRAAVGASPAALVAHVLMGGLLKVLCGVVLVLPLAVPLLVQSSTDPTGRAPSLAPFFWSVTWWSVLLCGGAVVVLGCYLAARIAARTDLAILMRET
jgi:hypothetical protein